MKNKFINSATNTLKVVVETMQQRGEQYADTWGKDGCWNLSKAVIEKQFGIKPTVEQCESIALACFIDQKYSRFSGGYKQDTTVDLVSYLAALADTMNKPE